MLHQPTHYPVHPRISLSGSLRYLVPAALSHLFAGFALLCAGARMSHALIAIVVGFVASTALHEMVANRTQP